MARHKVDEDKLKDYSCEVQLVGAYGKGEHKSLRANIIFAKKSIEFRVYNHEEIVAVEQDLDKAIEIYNEI